MANVYIVGGAGFGGSGLAKHLVARGHKVTIMDRVGPLQAPLLRPIIDQVDYQWASLMDIKSTDLVDQDIVIHLAAQADVPYGFTGARQVTMDNVFGTVCLLEALKDAPWIKRIIYAGSGNEFGRAEYLPIDESHPLTPHNPYSFSKAAAEMAFRAWRLSYDLPVVYMSNGAVIGPNMRREIFIYKWLRNIALGRPIMIEGGDQTRDVTHVDDVVQAWIAAVEHEGDDIIGEKFQVSYGAEFSIDALAEMCYDITSPNIRLPIIHQPYRPGEEGQRELFTNQKARDFLGYDPQIDPATGIAMTWEWIQQDIVEEIRTVNAG